MPQLWTLQSRTNKVDKSDISAPRQYFSDIFSENCSARRNTSKNTSPKFFPRAFWVGQILIKNQWYFRYLSLVDNGIQVHHCPLGNCAVTLLLANCPRRGFSGEWNPISIHKPPRAIDEFPNDVNRAWVERSQCRILCILECLLLNLTISVLDPSPVLKRGF